MVIAMFGASSTNSVRRCVAMDQPTIFVPVWSTEHVQQAVPTPNGRRGCERAIVEEFTRQARSAAIRGVRAWPGECAHSKNVLRSA
jgi:hypothetical protein